MSRRANREQLDKNSANCLGGVLSGARCQDVGSLEPIWSFNSHLPVLSGSCSSDRHAPVATSVSERVFDVRPDFLTKPNIAEVLELNGYSHVSDILASGALPRVQSDES